MTRRLMTFAVASLLLVSLCLTASTGTTAALKTPTAIGTGGAVATVDQDATEAGLSVLRAGGNAVDAAVAAAAALGVTEPYSAGIGGGGFFVYYDAATGKVSTLDGRETAPSGMEEDSFLDSGTGKPIPFKDAVNSGLSVGVPGTAATWDQALRSWGTRKLPEVLKPAIRLAAGGFTVDEEFHSQTRLNEDRFRQIKPTAELFLPGGKLPEVGSTFRNPALAKTYIALATEGVESAFYDGDISGDIVDAVRRPPMADGATWNFRPGSMSATDIRKYRVRAQEPTRISHGGLDVYGMAPSSSGGIAVGEALNILGHFDLKQEGPVGSLHRYLGASRLAFADRNRYVGDKPQDPVDRLLGPEVADSSACLVKSETAIAHPAAPIDLAKPPACRTQQAAPVDPYEGTSTTHLVTADKWGNVVSYTLTIEQTGGSAITVPGRGFLLNNELTDFDMEPITKGVYDPNLPAAGKRPRSSMSPTFVLSGGKPLLAVGSPGGATIITTVLQVLMNRLDLGMSLPEAVAAARLSQRNREATEAEPAFMNSPLRAALEAKGHKFVLPPGTFTEQPEIGAVAALEFLPDGMLQAAAEPVRRGGGSAGVVLPG
ncbi:gamma-glutamyltransferase [Pseudonocardiaceae bacterium YIM PH 21723]|nr:gamma-glutamyltransferase [Pseudonocardiaceae bacterium YIM PH 21723]